MSEMTKGQIHTQAQSKLGQQEVGMENWLDRVESSKTRSHTSLKGFFGKKNSEEYTEVQASIREVVKYTSDPLTLDVGNNIATLKLAMRAYARLIRACEAYDAKGDRKTSSGKKRKNMVLDVCKEAKRDLSAVKHFYLENGKEELETPWSKILADGREEDVDLAWVDNLFKTAGSSNAESSAEASKADSTVPSAMPSVGQSSGSAVEEPPKAESSAGASKADLTAPSATPSVGQSSGSAVGIRFNAIAKDAVKFKGENGKSDKDNKDKVRDQLSAYFGDAGPAIPWMFFGYTWSEIYTSGFNPDLANDGKELKTVEEVCAALPAAERVKFLKFLTTTIEGKYLASLKTKELKALMIYTTNAYTTINGILRESIDTNTGKKYEHQTINGVESQELIDNIDSAIEAYGGLKKKMILYRGVNVGALKVQTDFLDGKEKEMLDDIYINRVNSDGSIDSDVANDLSVSLQKAVGRTISDKGYVSTSPAEELSFAKYLSCPIILKILAPEGTQGAYINQISQFYNEENEFLLARDTKLEIVSVSTPQKRDNVVNVDNEEHVIEANKIIIECFVKSQPPRKTTKALQGK